MKPTRVTSKPKETQAERCRRVLSGLRGKVRPAIELTFDEAAEREAERLAKGPPPARPAENACRKCGKP